MKEEELKKIAELREILEERIIMLDTELKGLQVLLEFVNKTLLEQSFKRVETVKPNSISISEENIQMIKINNEVLANLYIGKDSLRFIPAEEKKFNMNMPPFTSFFYEKILQMQERDRESAEEGRIPFDKVFSFNVKIDGDLIREIILMNVIDERKSELISIISWTIKKMYEKMRNN